MTTERPISKAEFAALCAVHKSRVSHWIKEGKISGEAIIGTGPLARIVPSLAQRQLKIRLDAGQRSGNGLGTKLNAKPKPTAVFPPAAWAVIRELPALLAWHVAANGGDLEMARRVNADAIMDLTELAERVCNAPLPGTFDQVNWASLAEEYGAPAEA